MSSPIIFPIFPAVTTLQLESGSKPALWGAAPIAASVVWIGIGASDIGDFPTEAIIVLANFVFSCLRPLSRSSSGGSGAAAIDS